jgi:Concanavalin A-like lectin/glucanases superfamily
MPRSLAIAGAIFACAFATAAAPAAAATPGLVGHWPLSEGAGTTVADSSGFGAQGTMSGGVSWLVTPHGTALAFDGGTGIVQIPDAPQLEPSPAVTVSAWIARGGSPGDFRYVLSKGATGCIAAAYGLYSGPNGGLEFYVSHNRGTQYAQSPDAGPGVWDGNWHLVVGTFDGSTVRLYVDGTEVGSGTPFSGGLGYGLFSSNSLYIGDYAGCQRKNFLGAIADVQIWNRALGAGEVYDMVQPPAVPVLPPSVSVPSGGPPIVYPVSPPIGDSSAPTLSGLTLKRSNFTTVGIKALRVVYTDLYVRRVRLTVLRLQTVRCLKRGAAHQACAGYRAVGGFGHNDQVGPNSVRLPKSLSRLKPGRYQLVVSASGAGSVHSGMVRVAFRVVP